MHEVRPEAMRHVVSYVQRGERMTVGQERAWDRSWTRLGRHVAGLPDGPLDTAAWFGCDAPVVLEIGSGMGEATAALAAARPDLDHLAVEVYKPGLAQLLLRIEEVDLPNLRLLRGDALDLLHDHIAPDALRGVHVYFPDPWPKRKHHKRRLVTSEFVALAASRLVPGGTLHLATDWEHYAGQMRDVVTAEPSLRPVDPGPDGWTPRPEWRPVSKFEQRAQQEGRRIRDVLAVRVEPDG